MNKQSNLEKIGLERRNQHELIRNDIKKTDAYDSDHDTAKWHEGALDKPLGKGTNSGYGHTIPSQYNESSKNNIKHQLNTEEGGGSYDINGHPEKGGGRKFLQSINIYSANNPYGVDGIDTEINIEDGQVIFK